MLYALPIFWGKNCDVMSWAPAYLARRKQSVEMPRKSWPQPQQHSKGGFPSAESYARPPAQLESWACPHLGAQASVGTALQGHVYPRLVRKQGGPVATFRVVVVVAASPGAAPVCVLAIVLREPSAIAAPVAVAPLDLPVLAAIRVHAILRVAVVVTASPRAAPRLIVAIVLREPSAIAAPVAAVGIEMSVRLSSQVLLDLRLVLRRSAAELRRLPRRHDHRVDE